MAVAVAHGMGGRRERRGSICRQRLKTMRRGPCAASPPAPRRCGARVRSVAGADRVPMVVGPSPSPRKPGARLSDQLDACWRAAATRRTRRRSGDARRRCQPAPRRATPPRRRQATPAAPGLSGSAPHAVGRGCAEPAAARHARMAAAPPPSAAAPPLAAPTAAATGCERGSAGSQTTCRRPRRRRAAARREQAVGDAGAEDAKAEQRQRGEHDRHGVVDGRRRPPKPAGELGEQGRADADDDGEHQDLDAGGDHVAEHRSAMKALLPNRPKGISTKPASVVSLNSIRVTKSWIARMKKASSTSAQARSMQAIWMKFSKNDHSAHQAGDGLEQRAGRRRDRSARPCRGASGPRVEKPVPQAFRPRPAKLSKTILRQIVPVADEVGEHADEERLLDQARHDVVVGAPSPEKRGERHVDDDQRGGDEARPRR